MEILMLGDRQRVEELTKKIPAGHKIHQAGELYDTSLATFDLVFDLNFDDSPQNIENYASHEKLSVFSGAMKIQLTEVVHRYQQKVKCHLFGMNSLPGFINRDLLELTLFKKEDQSVLGEIASKFSWKYKIVDDRVGMVTPRIIFMIINEACYTVQEGTASMEDIDLAMKLGTNYPYGPFEWADKIGLRNIFETLSAIYEDTKDERYKICPLLKTKYLKGERFFK